VLQNIEHSIGTATFDEYVRNLIKLKVRNERTWFPSYNIYSPADFSWPGNGWFSGRHYWLRTLKGEKAKPQPQPATFENVERLCQHNVVSDVAAST
jgi:hypothetical protein